ncbi:MAG: PfkB family carbohydrate kinase [Victivallaceae bacterium]|nr:PfkB family carbohydrate kinase [Victivallaceae bacterium]
MIAVFGANPAWQKTVYYEKFTPGEVNRAIKMDAFASGKGVNFCRALHCAQLGEAHLFQFADGDNGKKHQNFLDREKIRHTSIATGFETRICSTCIDLATGSATELIEPSFPADETACAAMVSAWASALPDCQGCAITGSLPDKTNPALYGKIIREALMRRLPLLIDAVSGIGAALKTSDRFILKINASELKKLMRQDETVSALRSAAAKWSNAVLAITDGSNNALLAADGKSYTYSLPEIKVVNPIGSGDTASAVLLGNLLSGMDAPSAFARALAAASANCLDPTPGHFDPAVAEKLLPEAELFTP